MANVKALQQVFLIRFDDLKPEAAELFRSRFGTAEFEIVIAESNVGYAVERMPHIEGHWGWDGDGRPLQLGVRQHGVEYDPVFKKPRRPTSWPPQAEGKK